MTEEVQVSLSIPRKEGPYGAKIPVMKKKFKIGKSVCSSDDEFSYEKNASLTRRSRKEIFQREEEDFDEQNATENEQDEDDADDDDYSEGPTISSPSSHTKQHKRSQNKLEFDEEIVLRRAALGLLPEVDDPEAKSPLRFSSLKSSRHFRFSPSYDKVELDLHINEIGYDDEQEAPIEEYTAFNGGYRMCRATRGFKTPGKYYWELSYNVNNGNHESHVRFGIATVKAEMEFPVGYDDRGYCIRDMGGAYHNSKEFPSPPFKEGDIVGLGFEIAQNDENPSEPKGSLSLWINGEYQGVIFEDIDCTKRWFPAVSIYFHSVVTSYFSKSKGNTIHYLPEGWAPADRSPFDYPKRLISINTLLKKMREFPNSKADENVLKAISVALVPKQDMPY